MHTKIPRHSEKYCATQTKLPDRKKCMLKAGTHEHYGDSGNKMLDMFFYFA